jgi:putative FmdB family regulatory protein
MPIYEYECTECGLVEEALQKFTDSPLTTCKKCSGKLHKLISHSSFHLKGAGWYVTDYASGSSKPGSAAKTSDGTAPSPKTESSAVSPGSSES